VDSSFTAIQNGDLDSMKTLAKKSKAELVGLVKMVQGDLDRSLRSKVMCMITLDTHSRDIMDKLIVENVRKADEF
jgi:dynein heavy chain